MSSSATTVVPSEGDADAARRQKIGLLVGEQSTITHAAKSPPIAVRGVGGPMNPAGAEKVDPMDLAFDGALEREATDAEIGALREARAEAAAGAALIPHEEVMRRAREHFGVE